LERLPPVALYPAIVSGGNLASENIYRLSRFVYRPEPPTPSTAPFDDGLVEIARLIAGEEPVRESAEARRLRSGA
jgi:hypothetical protein